MHTENDDLPKLVAFVRVARFVTFSFPMGMRIREWSPSSWRQATVHRTVALKSSNLVSRGAKDQNPQRGILVFWSEWRDSNSRHPGPKELMELFSDLFSSLLVLSTPKHRAFRTCPLHCFHVFRTCLWSKMWSKPLPTICGNFSAKFGKRFRLCDCSLGCGSSQVIVFWQSVGAIIFRKNSFCYSFYSFFKLCAFPIASRVRIMSVIIDELFEYLMTGDSLSFFGSCFFFAQENLERREVS